MGAHAHVRAHGADGWGLRERMNEGMAGRKWMDE